MPKYQKILLSLWPVIFLGFFAALLCSTPGSYWASVWAYLVIFTGPVPVLAFLAFLAFLGWWEWINE